MSELDLTYLALFAGIGGQSQGWQSSKPQHGSLRARWRCLGGVDVDADAMVAYGYSHLAGVPGTVLDLMDREQYEAYHGTPPPAGWREATPEDLRRVTGGVSPDCIISSPPCKGFSGLLSQAKSTTDRYQALNGLVLRGLMLALEAWAYDPPKFFVLENVPRAATRGRRFLDAVHGLLEGHGYSVSEAAHCLGEVGGLAQRRHRLLLVARHRERVPPYLYQPPKRPLRSVGEVIGPLPLPDDERAGPMHRSRRLQWKTWVRLSLIPAGRDWRALRELEVVDGYLRDLVIVPDTRRGDYLGVLGWEGPAGTVTGQGLPSNGRFSVADPRIPNTGDYGQLGVQPWDRPSGTVTGKSEPGGGRYSVADPRTPDAHHHAYRVTPWGGAMGTVTGARAVGGGAGAVADPRLTDKPDRHYNQYRVGDWGRPAGTVTTAQQVGSGAACIADPRLAGTRHNNVYRVARFEEPSPAVTCGGGPSAGGLAIADPRAPGESKWRGGGPYGIVEWDGPAGAVCASARHDNGGNSVADPRPAAGAGLPVGDDRGVWVIRSLDGSWHRPFTTLELAALQGFVDPADPAGFVLPGTSDSAWRTWVGNAVPPPAAAAIADVIGRALLAAAAGEVWLLSAEPVWARPIATAVSIEVPS